MAARDAANRAEENAATKLRGAIRALLDWGLTVRDAGKLLKLSPARISQIDLEITSKAGNRAGARTKSSASTSAAVRRNARSTSVTRTDPASALAQPRKTAAKKVDRAR